ncbi:MAG: UDP-3-O-acyl-N-acetylglucosamine deacetylase [Rhodospirillaceae bacterium]|nr:UDP-3-O-acyl-N-acetylglucosamine deacetylase [Rhodospirillaceae bacterium]
MIKQKTLKSGINCSGVGLHSGDKVKMTLLPGKPDTGIIFHRVDITDGSSIIPATWDNVVDTTMCTTLGNSDGVTISTVEHLMAAFSGIGIDNVIVEVNGPEVPVMDGSAAPFLFLIECAGVVEQNKARRFIRVLKTVTVEDGDKRVTLTPGDGFALDFKIEFESAAVSRQSISLGFADDAFKNEISRARTFGFLHEVEALRAAGLAKGGSLENAVVVSGDKILNDDGLRFDDEFVRHKVLDAVGDLYLAGSGLLGRFSGVCSGHAQNNRLLRALFADHSAWCYEELDSGSAESPQTGAIWAEGAEVAVAAMA